MVAWLLALSLISVAAQVGPGAVAVAAEGESASPSAKISLLNEAPQIYLGMKRYPKFYGDPHLNRETGDGSLLDRQYLLGSGGGVRDTLLAHGLVFDAGLTQVVQGVVSGDGDGGRYFGSGDLWGVLDTGLAGLWSGGLIYAHFEGNWGKTVAGTGTLLPLDGDAIMPSAPETIALSELLIFQALPAGFGVMAGKINWTAFADESLFANDERNQFLHEGLINNAVLGSFVPYTSLGVGILKQFGDEFSLAGVATSSATNALSSGFDDLAADEMTYGVAAAWTPTVGNLPGLYNLLAGYGTKSPIAFDIDAQYLLEEVTNQAPLAEKTDNYAMTLGFSQYVWVADDARRSDGLPVGFGPFARFGIAPTDRNLLDRFYSVGIGGNGGPLRRVDDNWGIGWAGSHFSRDFRRDAALLGAALDDFEHAGEAFYNVSLTPAVRLSLHLQVVDSVIPAQDTAVVLGTRMQVDL